MTDRLCNARTWGLATGPFSVLIMMLIGCQAVRSGGTSEVYGSETTRSSAIAASTIYNNQKHNIVTVWHPGPASGLSGTYVDLHSLGYAPLPEKFLIGDGLLTRAFLLVDTSQGSQLSQSLDRLIRGRKPKVIIEEVALRLDAMVGKRWSMGVDQAGDNPWDPKRFKPSDKTKQIFSDAGQLPVGHRPLESKQEFPVVPFERFLDCDQCSAYCLHKVLLAKLILDRVGAKSRMVTGALINQSVENGPFSTDGHSWIEMPAKEGNEGFEIIDPTWGKRGVPEKRHLIDTNWIMFSNQYRVPNSSYPILKLTR